MASPAQRHMMRVSAQEAAQRENSALRHASGYELVLMRLAGDMRTLKGVHSVERKAEIKRGMLPEYAPWVSGVLAEGRGAQDAVLMTVMVWKLDANDIAGALEIARYALKYGLAMPSHLNRPTGYFLAEDVAIAAERLRTAGEPVAVSLLLDTMALTESADMPDKVRAKLHKITGLVLRDEGAALQALEHLKRAMQLDRLAGVKKDIERLERVIKVASEPATETAPAPKPKERAKPKTAKRAKTSAKSAASTRKPTSATARR
ncbi:phage terminase small subunit [Hafnia paralvei]|uniref:phage terminase small subunit n=1 Tax=Hafnia paralvei TaxID=546367 RepID=UPI0010339148|nr:phage terminase small subunit [Hafnia paralvei]TBM28438.1 terminase [Hafnia paralvei]TBM30355.1 terminase [Hafnia paralvei]